VLRLLRDILVTRYFHTNGFSRRVVAGKHGMHKRRKNSILKTCDEYHLRLTKTGSREKTVTLNLNLNITVTLRLRMFTLS